MSDMQFRDPVFNVNGGIDCEIEHPRFGWIPISLTEEDYPELYPQVLAVGPDPYVPPTAEEILERLRAESILPMADLLIKLVQANVITAQEGKAWVRQDDIPTVVRDAIDALPATRDQIQAEIEARRNSAVARNSNFIEALAAAYNRTPEQVDTLFGIGV